MAEVRIGPRGKKTRVREGLGGGPAAVEWGEAVEVEAEQASLIAPGSSRLMKSHSPHLEWNPLSYLLDK